MAPKSALLTSGTDNLQKKTAPRNPMTTKEKITAAEAKKANHKIKPREPPTEKASKPKTLPPPGEAFLTTTLKSTDKTSTRPSKPMTTKEKLRAAEAMKKAKGGPQSQTKGKDAGKGGRKARGIKPPSVFSAVKAQDASTHTFQLPKGGKPSVLDRPTAKAKWTKQKLAAAAKQNASGTARTNEEQAEDSVFRIMELPNEVRNEIWTLVVVDPNFLVCPGLPTGREQPDLAMVSRQVRDEVLPIYYGLNIFGIELSPRGMPKGKVNGPLVIDKWGAQLEEKGWFGFIRKWAFDFSPPMGTGALRRGEEAKSLVVSVVFTKDQNADWKGVAEVHSDALCILPGSEECGKCIIVTSPKWLVRSVNDIADAAKGGNIRSRMITKLANSIKEQVPALADLKCKKSVTSKESGSVIECL